MDVSTGLTILGGAIGSAKVVEKILGPTSEYLGDGLKNWTERRVKNVGRIFENAQKRLGGKINENGTVPPKVLKAILDNGSFCDDELAAEYFGGVLASSRTEISRDDRGASITALVGRLTTYQIRSHYLFYSVVKEIFDGNNLLISNTFTNRNQLETFVSIESYIAAMEFSEGEDIGNILSHVVFGLDREKLIESNFEFGGTEKIKNFGSNGIIFIPSTLGVELFLWAHGKGNIPVQQFLETNCNFASEIDIPIVGTFKATH